MTSHDKEILPRRTKILYGSGDLGFSLTNTIVAVLFGIYLTDVVGLRPALAAAAVFIGRTTDYLNDPLVGYLSDRTRSRWGRRRPYLLFGFIPFGLTFALLWWIPPIRSQVGLAVYYALIYIVFDLATTVVGMPYYALTPELTLDYDERTSLTSYRMAFSIVGGLIAFTMPLMIVGTMRPDHAARVLLMGAVFGLVAAVPLLIVFLSTRERPEFESQEQSTLRESLRAARKNRPFVFAAVIFLVTWTSVDIILTMLLFFIKYRMRLEQHADVITGTIFVVALISLPAWEYASKRWNKARAYVVGISFWAVVQIALVVIAPSWGLPVTLVLAAMAGVGVGAAHVLPWSMLPDAVEWDELATGKRHEGMFYSLVTLMQKVASSIAVPLSLLVLDVTGYVANAPTQSASVVAGVRWMVGPVPAVLLLIGIGFALWYPLGRDEHAAVRADLAARRKAP